jgi:hypothetical protein
MKGRRKREQKKRDKRHIAFVWLKVSGPSAVLFGRHNNSGAFAGFALKASKSYGTSCFILRNISFIFLHEKCFVRLQQKTSNISTRHQVTSLQPSAAQIVRFRFSELLQ